ncbi:MAG: UDP-N-acetylglucosamine 2-epimerase (non-hydrolyzing) [Rhodospirillaceae bacterium]|jgi:UDP-N-acetylglucosamine 2-epimerase (non-hydrolysing)|nr:UDP-N-acetylglucosamine 2-epimerase (non-hydrolyzing) [Rhodospirillaceae bacterium]MBT4426752.1 UDP-N-acetylglucosamine 2-epimerase (non-hydrolyzing) [Rhodospirillaceae bacterium]MBT5039685.1 UDP-N-acetylglucosamine 2-epimerase (non-hydrolyzing) [Rhodospirillaceae bacterium]MBT5676563.1 UDP-N-acetylglucosamine 2-epimerase (non-hydrolyzing) [Rhodospirillaceae bacterium]MBT6828931.1 UDP-N-acetylglucosamine 2-epimerase (non-hydrolyzing) [Rhodospirillaceae bacterium]
MAGGKRKIFIVMGTRPEALKLAPVVQALRARPERFDVCVCATGQHREMLDQALTFMALKPDYNLDIMAPDQGPGDVTARILTGMNPLLRDYAPDLVIVQGDTGTAFAAALGAYYLRIPVAHVEAGLRTGNNYSPWPEEGNRRLIAALTRFHFAPTEEARENLLREGIDAADIFVTGNTVVDALVDIKNRFAEDASLQRGKAEEFSFLDSAKRLILVTSHRRENFGDIMNGICRALRQIVAAHADVELVYPVHLNPSVRGPVFDILGGSEDPVANRIHLIEPVDYISFTYLMMRAHIILTDSGGVQEESPSLGVPTLVMRDTTERPEAVAAGCARLVGTDEENILSEANRLLSDAGHHAAMSRAANPFGDGKAGPRIADILLGEEWS